MTTPVSHTLGLDLGQAGDWTALAVLRREAETRPAAYTLTRLDRARGKPYCGTPAAPGIVETVAGFLRLNPPLHGCHMALDRTGVGRPVSDAFRAAGLPVILWGVTITSGQEVRQEGLDIWCPKTDLISAAQTLLGAGRLRFAPGLPLGEALRRELKGYQVRITAAGKDTFGPWREKDKDDLVFAVALSCWIAERFPPFDPRSIISGGRMEIPRGVFGGGPWSGRGRPPDLRRLPHW